MKENRKGKWQQVGADLEVLFQRWFTRDFGGGSWLLALERLSLLPLDDTMVAFKRGECFAVFTDLINIIVTILTKTSYQRKHTIHVHVSYWSSHPIHASLLLVKPSHPRIDEVAGAAPIYHP
jgi:hypothetical protein